MSTPSNAPAVDVAKVAREAVAADYEKNNHPLSAIGVRDADPLFNSYVRWAELGARAMASALTAQAPGAVKVRELVWRRNAVQRDDWHADSATGRYDVGIVHGRYVVILRTVVKGELKDIRVWDGGGFEAAKAAAQADFAARSLSTIEAALPADGYVDAFYAIAKMLGVVAQPASPKEAWEREMRPRLEALTAAPPVARERPAYPEGHVDGPCVCGSWPGGPCLKCEWREAAPAPEAGGLVERARVAVEWATQQLGIGSWRPTRSRIEGQRNLIRDMGAQIEADAARIAELEAENTRLRCEMAGMESAWRQHDIALEAAEARATKAEADVVRKDAAIHFVLGGFGLDAPVYQVDLEDEELCKLIWMFDALRAALGRG